MPIPKKPGELREMLLVWIAEHDVESVMQVLHIYDPCFAKAAETGMPSFTLIAQNRVAVDALNGWFDLAEKHEVSEAEMDDVSRVYDAMRAWPNREAIRRAGEGDG